VSISATATRPSEGRSGPALLTRQDVCLALLPVAVLAAITLWWPENGDQALFIQAAARLQEGAVYYRDFWDIKQPGLYWFYALGDLIVPSGIGARLLEGALSLVAARLVLAITSDWDLRRVVRLAAPTMVLGPYLIYAYFGGLGQIEGLMNVLLIAVLGCTVPIGGRLRARWSWFIAGLALGAVPIMKTLYGPVPLVFLVPAVVLSWRIDAAQTRTRIGWGVVGAFIPVIATLAYFIDHHALELALRTTFELPAQVAVNPVSASILFEPIQAAKRMFPLIGPLAVLGLITGYRRGLRLVVVGLTGTAMLEFLLALPQVGTPYRWLMLATPLGLLAVLGLESLLSFLQPRQRRHMLLQSTPRPWNRLRPYAAGLAVAVLLAPTLMIPLKILGSPAADRFGLSESARIVRGQDLPPEATMPVAAAALIGGRIEPGTPIYVLGDPRITTLLHAVQAVPISGWTSELPPIAWAELGRELNRSRPRYIYIDGRDWGPVRTGVGAPVFGLLTKHYRKVAAAAEGAWYETSTAGTPLLEPVGNEMFRQAEPAGTG
jgi:hypothetical protein